MCLSIIIPTYNRASMLSDLLDSICALKLPDVEIIVIDDGSTDDTESVFNRFARNRNTPCGGARKFAVGKRSTV